MMLLNHNPVIGQFLGIVAKHGLQDRVLIRGSASQHKELIPFWSDIDVTFFVEKADAATLRKIRDVKKEYDTGQKEITLSIVITTEEDTPTTNYFHHHGVKPMSYNLQLAKEQGWNIPSRMNHDMIRANNAYRYYEIIHTFRREVVNKDRFDHDMVARGFHRLSYMLRYQVEIRHPENIDADVSNGASEDMIHEFFIKYAEVKKRWNDIREDDEQLQQLGEYLIDTYDRCHRAFLPILKQLGELYEDHY